jgi:hypothetical protein
MHGSASPDRTDVERVTDGLRRISVDQEQVRSRPHGDATAVAEAEASRRSRGRRPERLDRCEAGAHEHSGARGERSHRVPTRRSPLGQTVRHLFQNQELRSRSSRTAPRDSSPSWAWAESGVFMSSARIRSTQAALLVKIAVRWNAAASIAGRVRSFVTIAAARAAASVTWRRRRTRREGRGKRDRRRRPDRSGRNERLGRMRHCRAILRADLVQCVDVLARRLPAARPRERPPCHAKAGDRGCAPAASISPEHHCAPCRNDRIQPCS